MKTNATLRIDAKFARQAKVLEARLETSPSRLTAKQPKELTRRHRDCETAKHRALARLGTGFDLGWPPPASRGELSER